VAAGEVQIGALVVDPGLQPAALRIVDRPGSPVQFLSSGVDDMKSLLHDLFG
jgi:hypothetical protein